MRERDSLQHVVGDTADWPDPDRIGPFNYVLFAFWVSSGPPAQVCPFVSDKEMEGKLTAPSASSGLDTITSRSKEGQTGSVSQKGYQGADISLRREWYDSY